MRYRMSAAVLAGTLSLGTSAAQTNPTVASGEVLGTIRITSSVMAEGKPLPAGTYEIRLSKERIAPLAGQSADAQRVVEFVSEGRVVAREIAEVIRDTDPAPVGTSSLPVRPGTRVEMLKGGEFLRVSVKREGERYLIHLPVTP